jgi:hypothetical protein
MTAKEKARELVDIYRIMLMNSDTDCGQEILCTVIAKYSALIAVDEIIKNQDNVIDIMRYKLILGGIKSITMQSDYWNNVKRYIEEL